MSPKFMLIGRLLEDNWIISMGNTEEFIASVMLGDEVWWEVDTVDMDPSEGCMYRPFPLMAGSFLPPMP